MSRTTLDLWVGIFVAMGIAALLFLALKVGSISGSEIRSPYTLTAHFDNIGGLKARAPVKSAEKGELCFGTVDTWLVWNLTEGRTFVTDPGNASRTMLFNIHTLQWDEDLLALFDIPRAMLPEVKSSSEIYGHTAPRFTNRPIAIAGIAGDQQAALFGQQFDAFVLQQIHPRRPARIGRHMGQQLMVFDGDVSCQRATPALQMLLRTGEIRRHHIQQMRVQQGIHAAVLMLEISG